MLWSFWWGLQVEASVLKIARHLRRILQSSFGKLQVDLDFATLERGLCQRRVASQVWCVFVRNRAPHNWSIHTCITLVTLLHCITLHYITSQYITLHSIAPYDHCCHGSTQLRGTFLQVSTAAEVADHRPSKKSFGWVPRASQQWGYRWPSQIGPWITAMLQRCGVDPNLCQELENRNPAVPNLTHGEWRKWWYHLGKRKTTGTGSCLDIQFHWWSASTRQCSRWIHPGWFARVVPKETVCY